MVKLKQYKMVCVILKVTCTSARTQKKVFRALNSATALAEENTSSSNKGQLFS